MIYSCPTLMPPVNCEHNFHACGQPWTTQLFLPLWSLSLNYWSNLVWFSLLWSQSPVKFPSNCNGPRSTDHFLSVITVKLFSKKLGSHIAFFVFSLSFRSRHVRLVSPTAQHLGRKELRAAGEPPKPITNVLLDKDKSQQTVEEN